MYPNHLKELALNRLQQLQNKLVVRDGINNEDLCILRLKYSISQLQKIGMGVPTTCGYDIVIAKDSNIKENHVRALFYLSDMDSCVRIRSDMFHYFHPYAFYHQTVVPLILIEDKVIYNSAHVNVIGWGGGGTKADSDSVLNPEHYDEEENDIGDILREDLKVQISDIVGDGYELSTYLEH